VAARADGGVTNRVTRRDSFDSAIESFAVAARTGPSEQRVEIAGTTVALRFAGERLASALGAAFEHHPRSGRDADLTVLAWDCATADAPAPRISFDALDGGITAGARLEGDQPVECRYDGARRILSVYDRGSHTALFCVADADELPHWERSSPFRQLLAWYFRTCGRHLLHGAAVGGPDAGLLLVGRGGSGKSSSALACLEWPEPTLGVAGDDYCVVATEPRPVAWSLYRSAKVAWPQLEWFPRLGAAVVNRSTPDDEKALLMLGPPVTEPLAHEVAIDAIVAPTVCVPGPTAIDPLSRAAALQALAPSSMFQLAGPNAEDFRELARLVAGLPAWRLSLGGDPRAVPPVLAATLPGPT
jgi:hypothetical protein